MACFIAPASVAIITTALRDKFPSNWHIGWLNTLIWGGSAGLAVEHIAHGEIVFWPPFLTAMSSPTATILMLKEIISIGVPMAITLILVWIVMVVMYENFIAAENVTLSPGTAVR